MAGMLPGVECARRRRFHQSGDSISSGVHGRTRRPAFCLYTSNNEMPHASMSSLQRSILNQACEDQKLGGVAREAKKRLDERLRTQRKTEPRRPKNIERRVIELRMEVFDAKKSNSCSKRFNWAKFSWKATDQDECTICLDHFRSGETLMHLPCAHRFHSKCLVPWLETKAHCPCCRLEITVSFNLMVVFNK